MSQGIAQVQSKSQRQRVTAEWNVDGDDLVLRIPGAVPILTEGDLVPSSNGKTVSPLTVSVPAIAVPRGDEVLEFNSSGGAMLYHKPSASGTFSL